MTEPEGAADDLPDLTDQQRKFVEGILAGRNASDSYRAAYNTDNMLQESVWALASRLRADVKVSSWLAAARKAGLGHAKITLDGHLTELERLKELCIETGNLGAAVQAEQLRGKAAGHYIEQTRELPPDPLEAIQQLEAEAPEIAALLRAKHNISGTQH